MKCSKCLPALFTYAYKLEQHGMQISMLEIYWCHFNKLALKLQTKTYF